ncbi:MAG: RagB/SusD family nutrient uptake outer membrane protein [Labilibaculum sp.]|nr:RagB/SusD family nutrient uptake outer membrane protein [Labilibaculum sp.]MBI9057099.1 RagB/SusD family nutrient uptake outer membrane protein [Labilibaculum sp.]
MKKNILKYILGLMVVASLSSCEDHLTQVNPNEITTGSFWKTLNDHEMGLVSVYSQFSNGSIINMGAETNRSDMSWPGWGRPNSSNEAYLQTFNSGYNDLNNKWDALYKGIFRANQVIKGLEGIEAEMITEEEKEQWSYIMGQARFFRGLFHFYLHNSFNKGSVIIYDFVPETEEDFYQSLSTPEQVKEFYLADLTAALELLPATLQEYGENGNTALDNFKGRVLKGTAATVIGKSYLYEGNYDVAKEYFAAVINSGIYQLADISENGTTNGEFNSESILEVGYDANYKPEEDQYSPFGTTNNTANMLSSTSTGGYRGIYPSCWLIMAYKNDSIDINDPRNVISEEAGVKVYRKYSLRTSHSIALADDEDMPHYQKRAALASPFNNSETSYWKKNTNWDITTSEKDLNPPARSGVNYRVIRLADVYLMYAECVIKGGTDDSGVDEALMYINRVRQRAALQLIGTSSSEFGAADVDGVTYNAASVMDHLMYVERPLELSAEGHAIRHLDLRRWGIKKQRFEELSQMVWNKVNYVTVDDKGKAKTVWGGLLLDGPGAAELRDYQQAAVNYVEDVHAYWPIPNSETTANPNVN